MSEDSDGHDNVGDEPLARRDSSDDDTGDDTGVDERRPVFSGFGIAAAVLGLLSVAAIVLTSLIWFSHRDHEGDLDYKTRVLQTAVDWADVLVNMNKDNIDASVAKLHAGTVGELNTQLEKTIRPYTDLVKKLQSTTSGQINSASVESVYRNPDRQPGDPSRPDPMPPGVASRTDTVLIVATSVSENVTGAKPQTVQWNLRIEVSEVEGQLLISRVDFLR